jgi:hypothetical protein
LMGPKLDLVTRLWPQGLDRVIVGFFE